MSAPRPGGPGGTAGMLSLDELREHAQSGSMDTVLTAFTDMQRRLMGKRIEISYFLDEVVEEVIEGCDYLLALDMEMDPVPGHEMANWEKGYGDFAIVPDLATLRVIPWLDRTSLALCDAQAPRDPVLGPDVSVMGTRQPHLRLPRSRERAVAACGVPDPRRRCQSVPSLRGAARSRARRHCRSHRPGPRAEGQRVRCRAGEAVPLEPALRTPASTSTIAAPAATAQSGAQRGCATAASRIAASATSAAASFTPHRRRVPSPHDCANGRVRLTRWSRNANTYDAFLDQLGLAPAWRKPGAPAMEKPGRPSNGEILPPYRSPERALEPLGPAIAAARRLCSRTIDSANVV